MSKDFRALFFVVLGAFALCALITKSHVTSWNDTARFATIDSLANRGTFAVEGSSFARATSDTYRYRGHSYDGDPGIAVLGAGVAVALKGAGITIENSRSLWIYLITLFVIGGWLALGCGYAFAFARLLGYSTHLSAFCALLSSIATLNLPYAAVYSYHVPCGAALLAGLYHLFRIRYGIGHAFAAGIFLALAFAFDRGAVVAAVMAAVMLYRATPSRIAVFLATSVPLAGLELFRTWTFSGSIVPPALNGHSWHGVMTKGLSLDIRPASDYLSNFANVTIGHNGVFLYTPLTIVCLFGLVKLWQTEKPENCRLALAITATSAVLFALVVLFTADILAANYGERRFVDIFFILCIGLAPAIDSIRGWVANYVALAAVTSSIVMAALGTVNPFAGRNAPGYVQAAGEFERLARRAPLQAGLDIAAAVILIALVVRFWPAPGGMSRPSLRPHAPK